MNHLIDPVLIHPFGFPYTLYKGAFLKCVNLGEAMELIRDGWVDYTKYTKEDEKYELCKQAGYPQCNEPTPQDVGRPKSEQLHCDSRESRLHGSEQVHADESNRRLGSEHPGVKRAPGRPRKAGCVT